MQSVHQAGRYSRGPAKKSAVPPGACGIFDSNLSSLGTGAATIDAFNPARPSVRTTAAVRALHAMSSRSMPHHRSYSLPGSNLKATAPEDHRMSHWERTGLTRTSFRRPSTDDDHARHACAPQRAAVRGCSERASWQRLCSSCVLFRRRCPRPLEKAEWKNI